MILLLILPVWLLVMLIVAGLCAGAQLGDGQLYPPAEDLIIRRALGPDEGTYGSPHIDEETRPAALGEQSSGVGIAA